MKLLQRLVCGATIMFFVACTCRGALAHEEGASGDDTDDAEAVEADVVLGEPMYEFITADPFAAHARASNPRTTQPLEGA